MPSMWGQSEPKITRFDAHHFLDLVHVVFPERVDPDVLLEEQARILFVVAHHREAIARLLQLAEQVGQELGAVLDRSDPQVREALVEALVAERNQEVVRGALDVEVLDVRRDARTTPPRR